MTCAVLKRLTLILLLFLKLFVIISNCYFSSCCSEVMVNYCAGHCPSVTSYQYKHPYYSSKCKCCKAKVMAVMYVMMTCGLNAVKIHPRNNVIECECDMCRSR